MAPEMDKGVRVVRVEAGGGTGDRVYVTADGARIYERLGEHRVEVIEGEMKFGPTRIRVLR